MKVFILGLVIFLAGLTAAGAVTGEVSALVGTFQQNEQVCEGLDSGKIDVSGEVQSITITAPAGFLIDAYCVKAGSANQGDGPVVVTVNPPQASVTITHPSGKGISHYSYSLVPITETTTDTTTTTGTTTTTTGTTETTTTSTTPTTPAPTTPAPTTPAPTVPAPTTPAPTTPAPTTPEVTIPSETSTPEKPKKTAKPSPPVVSPNPPALKPPKGETLPFTP